MGPLCTQCPGETESLVWAGEGSWSDAGKSSRYTPARAARLAAWGTEDPDQAQSSMEGQGGVSGEARGSPAPWAPQSGVGRKHRSDPWSEQERPLSKQGCGAGPRDSRPEPEGRGSPGAAGVRGTADEGAVASGRSVRTPSQPVPPHPLPQGCSGSNDIRSRRSPEPSTRGPPCAVTRDRRGVVRRAALTCTSPVRGQRLREAPEGWGRPHWKASSARLGLEPHLSAASPDPRRVPGMAWTLGTYLSDQTGAGRNKQGPWRAEAQHPQWGDVTR